MKVVPTHEMIIMTKIAEFLLAVNFQSSRKIFVISLY